MDLPKIPGSRGLDSLDWCFFVSTLVISVLIGVYFATKNKDLQEYMLGGRNQKLLPVSLSMMTSFVSGLTLIGYPAEVYYHGPGWSIQIIGTFLSLPITVFILLPVFHRIGGISVLSYLEFRFNSLCKRAVSLTFMIMMTLYNAVVLFVPSLSLHSTLGISESLSIGLVGLSCIAYCTVGGIKAVIWTDFFQGGLMYLSTVTICYLGTKEAGGFLELWEISRDGGRLSLDAFFNFDLSTRFTFYHIFTGSVLINLFLFGGNQIQVQRSLSLPTLRLAQWSMLLCALFIILITGLSSYLGLILMFKYRNCDPMASHQIEKPDSILFHYVANELNYVPGLRGIFVAGIFASTLSTLSSYQNSMSAMALEDFIKPIYSNLYPEKKISERVQMQLGKGLALLFGLICLGITFHVGQLSGLCKVVMTLHAALGCPFVVCFLLGMTNRLINSIGMLTGMLAAVLFGSYILIYQELNNPILKPSAPISIASCPAIWSTNFLMGNKSSAADQITPLYEASHPPELTGSISELFGLAYMSYYWLPVFSFVITCGVAIIVSVLTGGCNQMVDDRYLVSWLQSSPFDCRDEHELSECASPQLHRRMIKLRQVKSYTR